MLSDYTPIQTTVTVGSGGSAHLHLNLHHNSAEGVYTPLDAWNNGQFAAISTGGQGTPWSPYRIVNNPAPGGLNPVFAQSNDYLYPSSRASCSAEQPPTRTSTTRRCSA